MRKSDSRRLFLKINLRLFNSVDSGQHLLYSRLAMTAHHSFNRQHLYDFHIVILLFDIARSLAGDEIRYRRFFVFSVTPCVINVYKVEAQGVCNDAEARKAHCRRADHRVERKAYRNQHSRCYRYADAVIEERPEKVFLDIHKRFSRKPYRRRYVAKLVFHKNYIRRIYRDVRPRSDSYSDVRSCKRRRIVYSVADHSDAAVLGEPLYDGFLFIGKHVAYYGVNPDLLCNSRRRALVITRQHNGHNAHFLQLGNRLCAVGLYGIRNGYYAERFSVKGKIERRFPFR